jgi:hypothetical protein
VCRESYIWREVEIEIGWKTVFFGEIEMGTNKATTDLHGWFEEQNNRGSTRIV